MTMLAMRKEYHPARLGTISRQPRYWRAGSKGLVRKAWFEKLGSRRGGSKGVGARHAHLDRQD
jgi:hypothetical protein